MRKLTAFAREVVLPGSRDVRPAIGKRYCRFKLRCGASLIHRFGVFAAEPIPAQRHVIEYTGQRIDWREVQRRSIRQHLYIFWLNELWAIDGGIGGSGAEFINHSCDPNLVARVGRGRIMFVSRRRIAAGEELTLDYNLDSEHPEILCTCGSPRCRGSVTPRISTSGGT